MYTIIIKIERIYNDLKSIRQAVYNFCMGVEGGGGVITDYLHF